MSNNEITPYTAPPQARDPDCVYIAIDAMGGDFGPRIVIPALALVMKGRPDVRFLVYGDENKILKYLAKDKALEKICTIVHTEKTVKNDDKPSQILRASKQTSMRMAIEAVKNGEAHAVVSAGNTGALMALSKMVLKAAPGIHRPALASILPGIRGDTVMLDLGANVLVDSNNLVQFAVLGSIFAKAQKKLERTPTVGLLNVGTEAAKGPDHVRGAAQILSKLDFPGQYKGFVEGNDITKGRVDVIVSDGYAGNIALKSVEGTGKMVSHFLSQAYKSNPLSVVGALFSYFAISKLRKRLDPRAYNGGVFLGLNGLCVKSHGGTDVWGFSTAVIMAVRLARSGYINQVLDGVASLNDQEETFLSDD